MEHEGKTMEYMVYDKYMLKWELCYCRTDGFDPTLEDIGNSMFSQHYIGKFSAETAICINNGKIKNDDKLFIMSSGSAEYIWQLGSKVTDMEGAFVPHLYYVRKIGLITQRYDTK